jgi:hypothetical protein
MKSNLQTGSVNALFHDKKCPCCPVSLLLSGSTAGTTSFEVRRILKAFVDAQRLADFDTRLQAYRDQLSGAEPFTYFYRQINRLKALFGSSEIASPRNSKTLFLNNLQRY